MPLIDEVFAFEGLFKRPAKCRIRIFTTLAAKARGRPRHDDEPSELASVVVIATELDDNPGTSITNAAEELAAQVCQHYRIHPSRLVWIEHYDDRLADPVRRRYLEGIRRKNGESFDLVTFDFRSTRSVQDCRGPSLGEPSWKTLAKDQVKQMIGEKLP